MWRALGFVALLGAAEVVIPPGREALVLEMLGGSAELPGRCRLEDARVDRTYVSARYTCAGRAVTVSLRHPREAPAPAVVAGEIAVVPGEGAPPELVAAIADRVRARADRWSWVSLEEGASDPGRKKPTADRPHRGAAIAGLILAPLIGVLARARWRRHRTLMDAVPRVDEREK